MHHQLRHQAVVVRRHGVAGIERAIDAHTEAPRRVIGVHPARAWCEGIGVFRRDAAFDRVAVEGDVRLRVAERLARRDADLFLHQVDAADHLGDGVFHLQARVHLDEGELPVLPEEFERAGIPVAELRQPRRHARTQRVALRTGEHRAAGFLDQLLVAALQGTIALAEMHHVAMRVGQHLQFDVARAVEVLFQIHAVVAEGRLRLAARHTPGFLELIGRARHLHAAPAAARGRLDQHGVLHLFGDRARFLEGLERAGGARHQRHIQPPHRILRRDLVAHHADMVGRGADELQPMRLDHLGEARVLAQESVAGMHRVGAGDGRGRQDGGDVEVGIARRRRADADALIGQAHMHRGGVRGGMHRDRADAHFLAGAVDTERDLAAVGDQHLAEHRIGQPIRRSSGARRIRPACRSRPGCA